MTPVTVHLTDDEIAEIRRLWTRYLPGGLYEDQAGDHLSIAVKAKLAEALPPPVQPLRAGMVLAYAKPENRSWTAEILAVYDNLVWVKHSQARNPEEYRLSDIQTYLRMGIWVVLP